MTAGNVQFDFTSAATGTTPADTGYGVASSSQIGTTISNNAAIVGSSQNQVRLGSDGNPSVFTDLSSFGYARGSAALKDQGSTTLTDGSTKVTIKWGVYDGGTLVDSSAIRTVSSLAFIAGQSTPAAVQANLSGTYSTVIGGSKFITETGKLGGGLSGASIVISAGKVVGYTLNLTDGLSRAWNVSCSTCSGGVPLTIFATSGLNLAGTGPGPGVTGSASGFPVGPTGTGVASSFGLKSTDAKGVAGAFVVK